MKHKSILQQGIGRFRDIPGSPSTRDQMAGVGTLVPKGIKEKAKTTSPDKAGRMTIRGSKEATKDTRSKVRKKPALRYKGRKGHTARSMLPSH